MVRPSTRGTGPSFLETRPVSSSLVGSGPPVLIRGHWSWCKGAEARPTERRRSKRKRKRKTKEDAHQISEVYDLVNTYWYPTWLTTKVFGSRRRLGRTSGASRT